MLGWIFDQLVNLTVCRITLIYTKQCSLLIVMFISVSTLPRYHFHLRIGRIVKELVEGPPRKLLEIVAEIIASTTLNMYPQVSAVRVQVGKPHVAVQGPVDCLGVEIIRHRDL